MRWNSTLSSNVFDVHGSTRPAMRLTTIRHMPPAIRPFRGPNQRNAPAAKSFSGQASSWVVQLVRPGLRAHAASALRACPCPSRRALSPFA